jgi:hypothetical protein
MRCASRTHTQSVNTCIALSTTKKGTSTMAKYYTKMKHLADEMSTASQQLGDEEFVAMSLHVLMKNSTIP